MAHELWSDGNVVGKVGMYHSDTSDENWINIWDASGKKIGVASIGVRGNSLFAEVTDLASGIVRGFEWPVVDEDENDGSILDLSGEIEASDDDTD